ncbi:MAG: Uma2 family endonuclease [Fimbriimonadales bacterium]|nr:Uma2 family endonuclease [Fimbriimonadales bacterium]
MSQATLPMQPAERPPRFKFSRAAYEQMARLGLFEGRRVELIEGEVIEMPPSTPEHFETCDTFDERLQAYFGKGYWVRFQGDLVLGESQPVPDIAVVQGDKRDYKGQHPDHALLVVEVAHTSLHYDRTDKLSLYAKAGIPEYWIVNLPDGQLEVYREPVPREDTPFGYGYAQVAILREGEIVRPLAKPEPGIPVGDVLGG